ncbi:CocE/NonD family hydrolase [Sphingobacterium sp. SYP-B4668]|uniref:CocE/NonD family hydrolase n=1 Tax=Sphingobacterium sp. SYP-B4668 TaxID=2996035 RepID=UPI0022DE80D0|nr:CocE/NonD family hydrolase [Sphingobacterium sp. SYP-B4668]
MNFKTLLLFWFFAISVPLFAQQQSSDSAYVRDHYTKIEHLIPMRDGVKLFTAIYIPKDQRNAYPFLINRTPYTVSPYGEQEYKKSLGNFPEMMRRGYIFVYQDVRGKWMSEGNFEDVRPQQTDYSSKQNVDESTDIYDTIDWLIKNIKNNNGNAGLYGISYPGFYATASLVNSHPALKAVSPQAPVTDWFIGDDFHHGGALFLMDAFRFMSTFGVPRPQPITPDKGPKGFQFPIKDQYQFYLQEGSVKNLKDKYFADSIKFWNDLFAHPDYDNFWQSRVVTKHLHEVKPAVMVVGGFFDAEDAYGALHTYKAIEKQNQKNKNILVMGPWFHGGWVRGDGSSFGDISFNNKTSITYQQSLELPFFEYYLKGKGEFSPPEATIFLTGSNEWKNFTAWPPRDVTTRNLYLHPNGQLSFEKVQRTDSWDEYISDPSKPVPFQDGVWDTRSREYMIDDQRFAAKRPDVMTYQTAVLTDNITVTGPVIANLIVTTTGTDADYIVKLIDVFPEDTPNPEPNPNQTLMGGYQMLVRGEILRGKYRNSFSHPEPFVPGEITKVNYELPDIGHTFKKGHRIMIQIQHSWFPLADRNPQKFMNIYEAGPADFQKATHRIFHDVYNSSYITLPVLAD